jgi:DNA-binding transcriptional LysR family regulator
MGVSTIPSNRQWLFQTPAGPRAFEVVPGAAVNNADCVYQFALAGMGIARLNEFIVADALRDGRLVQLLADFHCTERLKMLAIYPQERHRLPRVRAMLDFIHESFSSRPWRTARGAAKTGAKR